VPPSASRKRPSLSLSAPVKAPFRDEVLAAPGLAADEDRDVVVAGEPLRLGEELEEGPRDGDDRLPRGGSVTGGFGLPDERPGRKHGGRGYLGQDRALQIHGPHLVGAVREARRDPLEKLRVEGPRLREEEPGGLHLGSSGIEEDRDPAASEAGRKTAYDVLELPVDLLVVHDRLELEPHQGEFRVRRDRLRGRFHGLGPLDVGASRAEEENLPEGTGAQEREDRPRLVRIVGMRIMVAHEGE